VRDVRAAWEWATRARDGACAGRVLLWGHSLAAAVAAQM